MGAENIKHTEEIPSKISTLKLRAEESKDQIINEESKKTGKTSDIQNFVSQAQDTKEKQDDKERAEFESEHSEWKKKKFSELRDLLDKPLNDFKSGSKLRKHLDKLLNDLKSGVQNID